MNIEQSMWKELVQQVNFESDVEERTSDGW